MHTVSTSLSPNLFCTHSNHSIEVALVKVVIELNVFQFSGQFSVLHFSQSPIQHSWSLTPRTSRTLHSPGFSPPHWLILLSLLPGHLGIRVPKDSSQKLSLFSPQVALPSTITVNPITHQWFPEAGNSKLTYSTLIPSPSSFPANTIQVVKLKLCVLLVARVETCDWISSTQMHTCKIWVQS